MKHKILLAIIACSFYAQVNAGIFSSFKKLFSKRSVKTTLSISKEPVRKIQTMTQRRKSLQAGFKRRPSVGTPSNQHAVLLQDILRARNIGLRFLVKKISKVIKADETQKAYMRLRTDGKLKAQRAQQDFDEELPDIIYSMCTASIDKDAIGTFLFSLSEVEEEGGEVITFPVNEDDQLLSRIGVGMEDPSQVFYNQMEFSEIFSEINFDAINSFFRRRGLVQDVINSQDDEKICEAA